MNQHRHDSYGYGYGGIAIDDDPNPGSYDPSRHFKIAMNAGFEINGEAQSRILYIGNLEQSVNEEFLLMLFGQVGQVVKVKLINDAMNSECYAFVEFLQQYSATLVMQIMNNRIVFGREMKVSYVKTPITTQKIDTSHCFNIFVGDLSPDVSNIVLKEAFSQFGDIVEAKVLYDPQTLRSKGYGFVSFKTHRQAEAAIEQMKGQYVGKRPIRTNWANRKQMEIGDQYGSSKDIADL